MQASSTKTIATRPTRARTSWGRPATTLAALSLFAATFAAACAGDQPSLTNSQNNPPIGASNFVSADGQNGQLTSSNDDMAAGESDRDGASDRSVEEGDIYRVISGDRILNLNSYRGLQVINFADVTSPSIEGQLQVTGTPVEMYVVDDIAYVLMNNWTGYYGSRTDIAVQQRSGGLVLTVDISDPTNPVAIEYQHVPGNISTSRLTRGSDGTALYVVANGYIEWTTADGGTEWGSRTYVRSFNATNGHLAKAGELDLGGYVAAVQATPDRLIVARTDWNSNSPETTVSLVDISDAQGAMIEGDEIESGGYVNSQFNLDVQDDVLRVVSGDRWSGNTNHVQTFDASDIHNITPIDHETFGDGQDLYATIFLEDSAFFVTYRRQDPFHAFDMSADGDATEMSEFIVSGWNDFFRPVADDTRLVGIGINDEDGRQIAVSLYDITDLENANPMIARAEVEGIDWGWSEANWDHRAFSVLEDAVDVYSDDGVHETGLVLLPFSGWDNESNAYVTAVQLFTFSDTTLTQRGAMNQSTAVRRAFLADSDTAASLGEAELSLFDHTNPDDPQLLGNVQLAPDFSDLIPFGDYFARVQSATYNYYNDGEERPTSLVEIIARDADPNTSDVVASFEIPGGSQVHASGTSLVAVNYDVVDYSNWPYTYETTITNVDLSDPRNPQALGELVTDAITPGWAGYYGYGYGMGEMDSDCFDCRGGGYGGYGGYNQPQTVFPLDDAIAFLSYHPQQESLGMEEVCYTYVTEQNACETDDDCTYYSGQVTCRQLEGDDEYCSGQFYDCNYRDDGNWSCDEIADASPLEQTTTCYTQERYRYWQSQSVEIVSLAGAAPTFVSSVALPVSYEGVSAIADESSVYLSYRLPVDVADDGRPYVQHFFEELDLSTPTRPLLRRAVNVPGQLIAVDGNTLYTQDTVWGDEVVETAVARLEQFGNSAFLQAWHRFEDQQVYNVALDDIGNMVVSHRVAWLVDYGSDNEGQRMSILDARTLESRASVEVDAWATFQDVSAGRALFQVTGGLLVMNLDDATAPFAQAFFPTRGWPQGVSIDGDDIVFAAGRYGAYTFDVDSFNLLPPATL